MTAVSIGDIVDFLGADFKGDRSRAIRGVRPLNEAGPDDLSFLANPKYQPQLAESAAGAVLVAQATPGDSPAWLRVKDPYLAVALVLQKWFDDVPRPEGISERAAIASTARVGRDVRVGPFASIGDGAEIGDGVTIFEGVSIGAGAKIGAGTTIYPNAVVYHRCEVGRNCIVHAGAVIGSDGYGFATSGGKHHKIPQIGIVRIGDDVEIGAGTAIDRAALGETVVGDGTKIDNHVQIGHNVRIGKHCLIVAEVGIAGSTEIGDYVVFAGKSGAVGHIKIGSHVQVAGASIVTKDWDGPIVVGGNPARPLREYHRVEAWIHRLGEVYKRLGAIERKLGIDRHPGEDKANRQ
jgi:UDP-3-O-[3-hydroxymyristoyl] glucosamine N-acyltransferase